MAEDDERYRLEQIREIDMEELQIEEVDEADISSSDDDSMNPRHDEETEEVGDITYNACLVSMDSYIEEVDDTHRSATFLDSGAIVYLPMFYAEVVLFPKAILPLRVIASRFRASLEKALNQIHAPATLGVVYVHKDHDNQTLHLSPVGTTAEIQQYRLLKDGSFNVVIRGKQRFHLQHRWIDSEGAPCAEVRIIQEDTPLRTPRDAFGQLASVTNVWTSSSSYRCSKQNTDSEASFENDLSLAELQLHESAIKSCQRYYQSDRSVTSNSSPDSGELDPKLRRSKCNLNSWRRNDSVLEKRSDNGEGWKIWTDSQSKLSRLAPNSFWPHWVYRMYDSYSLAQRAAVMWKKIIGSPSMDEFAKKPDNLSFHIASKVPVSESARQKLLEIDGVSYRLRREIEILECFDCVHCKVCQTVIAKRSEMLVTNSDGPLSSNVNIHDYVTEIKVYCKADGLGLFGTSSEEYSWFPGYAWTVASCEGCESVMGWRFTAVDKTLRPDLFWAIRSSQVEKAFAEP